MKRAAVLLFLLLSQYAFSAEAPGEVDDDEYYDYGASEGITIVADRDKKEQKIIAALNQKREGREKFIEEELLVKSGFRRSANAKFRKTTGGEKALSALSGLFGAISFGLAGVPQTPFAEVEYDKLPKGEYYYFDEVIVENELKDVSEEILILMELEYKLQVEFENGVLLENWNKKYWTPENIAYFEGLILSLPDTEGIKTIKERFLTVELPKIKAALERWAHPGESDIQTREKLRDMSGQIQFEAQNGPIRDRRVP